MPIFNTSWLLCWLQVSLQYLEGVCNKLFSRSVRETTDFTRPGTAGRLLRESIVPVQPSSVLSTRLVASELFSVVESDYQYLGVKYQYLGIKYQHNYINTSTIHSHTAILWPFLRDYPGEPVPEDVWTL